MIKATADNRTIVLYQGSSALKTEGFLARTQKFVNADAFLEKVHTCVIKNLSALYKEDPTDLDCIKAVVGDFTLWFKFGVGVKQSGAVNKKDVVFFDFEDKQNQTVTNDLRFIPFLSAPVFECLIFEGKRLVAEKEFSKLYSLSGTDRVNLPLLNAEQNKIMRSEDKNVVVHGVAGSGKTNICIDKIVYTACRNYLGKVLYTTFSRGLLIDTKNKVESFVNRLKNFEKALAAGKVIITGNKSKAVSDYLGIYVDETQNEDILACCAGVRAFLETKVDYFLVEDLYARYFKRKEIVGEKFFTTEYVNNISDRQLSGKLSKISELSNELIYKEIFGLIFGKYTQSGDMLSQSEYTLLRKESLSEKECEIIYSLALDYKKYLKAHDLTDNNFMSREMLSIVGNMENYSLIICDETQDFTEVTLRLFKAISLKMFCVGDALQMINPSYFSFAGLKRILFEKDIVNVSELENNYRNKRKIADILQALSTLNTEKFGTHSFVVKGKSVDEASPSTCVFVRGGEILNEIVKKKLDAFTVVVSNAKSKTEVRKILKNQEVLTVSEIKGLERDTVLLYDVLSDNADKWERLDKKTVNRKTADENSVYRYYFNLFYVGVSRAKTNLYVSESKDVALFNPLFDGYFKRESGSEAVSDLSELVATVEITNDEIVKRIEEFIKNGQYDNAEFILGKLTDDVIKKEQSVLIDVNKKYVSKGLYRQAGVAFWENGLSEQARKMFVMSGDKALIDLMDACLGQGEGNLTPDIVLMLPSVMNNPAAVKLIEETLLKDINAIKEKCNKTGSELKRRK